jgi:16S rRNA (guanine(966)-N(2))-methyltransferase RsmD
MDWEHTRALDLFSGTGSIGFELLSRGCPEVICVEINRLHIAFIQKVRAKLDDRQLIPLCTDAFRFIETHNRPFDLIFADPPYDLPDLERIPSLILAHNLLTPTGLLVLEHPKSYNFADFPGFEQKRSYGAVNFSFITNPQPS